MRGRGQKREHDFGGVEVVGWTGMQEQEGGREVWGAKERSAK